MECVLLTKKQLESVLQANRQLENVLPLSWMLESVLPTVFFAVEQSIPCVEICSISILELESVLQFFPLE